MTATPSLSARIGRPLLDRMIDELAADRRGGEAERLVKEGLSDHLEELIGLGIVRAHDSLPNRRINVVAGWNGMFGDGGDHWCDPASERRRVADRIFAMLAWHDAHSIAWDLKAGRLDAEARERAVRKLEARMDLGTSDPLWAAEEHDFVSGEELSFMISGWNLVVGRRIRDWRTREPGSVPDPIEDLEPVRIHEVEIDAPTGRLLLAEWFHAPGFTDLVDEGNPFRGGSDRENEADAERYARDHGFASVATARRNLTVFAKGGAFGVGHHDEDGDHPAPEGCRRVADLMVDLRKVSVVDRGVLLGILKRIHPDGDVEAMVSRIEKDRDVIGLKVAPGRYRVSSSGRGYVHDLLDADDPFRSEGFGTVATIRRVR